LKNKEHIPSICKIAAMFGQFNFDMLKAMVEDMNRYNETPQETLKLLNAKPEFSDEAKYKVELQIDGIEIEDDKVEQTEWHGNPLTKGVNLDYKVVEKDENGEEDYNWKGVRFVGADLKQINPSSDKFVFVNDDGSRLVLTKLKEKTFHYDAF
jgi:hypothetical protein